MKIKIKIQSGSSRDKTQETNKQNKWNNPEYCRKQLVKPGKGILKTEYKMICDWMKDIRTIK